MPFLWYATLFLWTSLFIAKLHNGYNHFFEGYTTVLEGVTEIIYVVVVVIWVGKEHVFFGKYKGRAYVGGG